MNLIQNAALQAVATGISAVVIAHYPNVETAAVTAAIQGLLQLAISVFSHHYNTDGTSQRVAFQADGK